jgi:hypothetical protein
LKLPTAHAVAVFVALSYEKPGSATHAALDIAPFLSVVMLAGHCVQVAVCEIDVWK